MTRWAGLPETSGARTTAAVRQPSASGFSPFASGLAPDDSGLKPDATSFKPGLSGSQPGNSGFHPDRHGSQPDTAGLKPDRPALPKTPGFQAIYPIFSEKCTGEQKGGDNYGKRPNRACGG
jgi:hypothetical protein